MSREKLKSCFQDTFNFSNSAKLKEKTELAIQSSRIYKEGFISPKRPFKEVKCLIDIEDMTTLAAAEENIFLGKIAVLNFANPERPAGGVENGAMGQEQCLCRSSNLYSCLINQNVYEEYYKYHINLHNEFYSDRLIYTKDVLVFKTDEAVPQMMPEEEWFVIDVITCSAPYLAKRGYTNKTALKMLFKSRIRNIFEAAIDNDVDVLILGAFGCGAFKNPPDIVAKAFHEVILECGYENVFQKIIFPIKSRIENNPLKVYPNIVNFELEFKGVSSELGIECHSIIEDSKSYDDSMEANKYYKKQISILGDSISTLDGFNPSGYNIFYTGQNCEKSNVKTMADTWWGKVIDFFDGELLVNNSWSGSQVSKYVDKSELFPCACSDERTSGLHIGSVRPDVILVYMGVNDWARGVEPRAKLSNYGQQNECFDIAYGCMLEKLRKNYPEAEIWCGTLCKTFMSKNPKFSFPDTYGGKHIDKYNDVIREAASRYQCKILDFAQKNLPYDSIDGTHPNVEGMSKLAEMTILEMNDSVKEENSDDSIDTMDYGSEYVLLPIGITRAFYSDTIHLRVETESSRKDVELTRWLVRVGRDSSCDLPFDNSLSHIARLHAIFSYEHQTWFICDTFSHNGTLLNGKKLKSGVKYELQINDVICLPDNQRIIFEPLNWGAHNQTDVSEDEPILSEDCVPNMRSSESLIGTLIDNKYRVIKKISRNAFSVLYLAIHECLNRIYLIKVFSEKHCEASSYFDLRWSESRFSLDHPAIPGIFDVIVKDGYVFIIGDYVQGMSLDTIVTSAGAQPYNKVVEWAKQLCDVLGYLHTRKPRCVFRDVKPANIILTQEDKVRLVDFDIMEVLYEEDSTWPWVSPRIAGTAGFAPPEQYTGNVDPRSDIYALGVTMYNLLTGIAPTQMSPNTWSVRQINPEIPKWLELVICKCTEIKPENRYQSCAELLCDLERGKCGTHKYPKWLKKYLKRK